MSQLYSTVGNSVDSWMQHFQVMIDVKVVPDDISEVFLLDQKPMEAQDIYSKPKQDTSQNTKSIPMVKIVSPVAQELDSAKTDLADQDSINQPKDSDPITHFPEHIAVNHSTEVRKAYKNIKRKQQRRTNTTKGKKRKLSAWQKY